MFDILKRLFAGQRRTFSLELLAKFSDVTITVTFPDGTSTDYKLDRATLGNVYKILVANSTVESNICIKEKDKKVFEVFLKYIYQYISYDDLDELTVRQIDGLYLMSKTYEIAELSIICKYLLGLELNFIANNADEILLHKKLAQLDAGVLSEIINLPSLNMEELNLLHALYEYASINIKKRPKCSHIEDSNLVTINRTIQNITIKKICSSATNRRNFGTIIYEHNINSDQEILHIRNFLLSHGLINKVRILTSDVNDLLFDPIFLKAFDANDIIFIYDYLYSEEEAKPDIKSLFICSITEPRMTPIRAKRPRRAKLFAKITASVKFQSEFPGRIKPIEKLVEKFEYLCAVPMSIEYIVWRTKMPKSELDRLSINLIVDDIALPIRSRSNLTIDTFMKTNFDSIKGKNHVFRKGSKFEIMFETKSPYKRIDYWLLKKDNNYKILDHGDRYWTRIKEFGLTFHIGI
ncbi:uncharacterized protein LOC113378203 isoform X2 [Ctenocephalides felis]|uniref:uncharacterized protein LOC113378203 isoform X2 n=1 Tax=Ctenocephalides felis TaxID=7515 RepID=UPI000E6E40CF|nr:uncharacterized protein LOC113378203 isoform X2 [Ctenocephalides felis]